MESRRPPAARILRLSLATVLALPTAGVSQDLPPNVYVDGGDTGQGVLRARGSECFLITPHHVVAKTLGSVKITGERTVHGAAELLRVVPGDIAILRVMERGTLPCPEWNGAADVSALLRKASGGHLSVKEADGTSTIVPVTFRTVDTDTVEIRPSARGDEIRQGMSGASLIVNGALAGLLLTTNNGVGTVTRIDNILRLTESFFAPGATADSATARRLVSLLDL